MSASRTVEEVARCEPPQDGKLLQAMARAICKAQTQSEGWWQAFLPEACAALDAMRSMRP